MHLKYKIYLVIVIVDHEFDNIKMNRNVRLKEQLA